MIFYTILLLAILVSALSPMTLYQAPGFAFLLFLLAAPLSHCLQLRPDPERRRVTFRAVPVAQALSFPQGSKWGLGICCLLFALSEGVVLAAVAGAVPAQAGILLQQNLPWVMLLFVAVYLLFSRGRVSLPADVLFAGLLIALYKTGETLGAVSLKEAFFASLAREVPVWLALAAVCVLALEFCQKLQKRKRAAA